MTQNLSSMFSQNDEDGPPTHPLGLRDIIAREIEVLGPTCDLNHIDVSQMTSLADVFLRSDFNGDISLWDTSGITSLQNTFAGSRFNGDISKWDTSKVTTMAGLFQNTAFTGDISWWNTSRVRDMDDMFKSSQFDGELWMWDVSGVETMNRMFESSQFNRHIGDWDVRSLYSAVRMFAASQFTGDLSRWSMGQAKDVAGMFKKAAFSGDLSRWALREYADYRQLVSSDFQGILPQPLGFGDPMARYSRMLGSHGQLNAYLLRMPLNAVHAELLLHHSSPDCPEWLVADDFARLKPLREMALNLNYNVADARELFVSMIKTPELPSFEVDDNLFSGPI